MMETLIGLFLITHGLVHSSYLTPKPNDPFYPYDFRKGWFANLVGKISKPIGIALAVLVILCLSLAGLGAIGVPGFESVWEYFALVGVILSLLLLTLYWHPSLILGIVINIVVLYGLYALEWNWR